MSQDPSSKRRRLSTKKILVAAIGVASVSYVIACEENTPSSGNLMAPDASQDASIDVTSSSGNLMAPQDAGPRDAQDEDVFVSSGNLMAPPTDGGSDAPDGGG